MTHLSLYRYKISRPGSNTKFLPTVLNYDMPGVNTPKPVAFLRVISCVTGGGIKKKLRLHWTLYEHERKDSCSIPFTLRKVRRHPVGRNRRDPETAYVCRKEKFLLFSGSET